MNKFKNLIDKNRKILIIIGGLIIISLIIVAIIELINNKTRYNGKINYGDVITDYSDILQSINNKDTLLIYYYNSRSNNKYHSDIKEYLDELDIKYYGCDDISVSKVQYEEFLKVLGIDKDLFGMPALIYIKDGKMYGNLINIDSKEAVKQFIDNYDLYTIKK